MSFWRIHDGSCHCICSPALRIIITRRLFEGKGTLVIKEAPHLERLLLCSSGLRVETIQIVRAPKLDIVGLLSPCILEIQIANLVFQEDERVKADMKNVRHYDHLDPIRCLESHLKILVLKNYEGGEEEIDFARFFVLNAKVMKKIKFVLCKKIHINEKWMTDQLSLLKVENRSSQEPQLEFRSDYLYWDLYLDTRDLLVADPFDCCFEEGFQKKHICDLSRAFPLIPSFPDCVDI